MSAIKLFEFQREASDQLAEAAQEWVTAYASQGPLKLGRTDIPFLGQLKAVTGAGKAPILARVCGEIGPALVLWTSKSSAVVEQTYRNLLGKYRALVSSPWRRMPPRIAPFGAIGPATKASCSDASRGPDQRVPTRTERACVRPIGPPGFWVQLRATASQAAQMVRNMVRSRDLRNA